MVDTKRTKASKRRWASIPKEERSRIMSERVSKGWAAKSKRARSAHARKLNELRWGNKKDV